MADTGLALWVTFGFFRRCIVGLGLFFRFLVALKETVGTGELSSSDDTVEEAGLSASGVSSDRIAVIS